MKRLLLLSLVLLSFSVTLSAGARILNIEKLPNDQLKVTVENPISGPTRHSFVLCERRSGSTDRHFRAQETNYTGLPNPFYFIIDVELRGNVEFFVETWMNPYYGPAYFVYPPANYYEIYITLGQAPPLSDE